MKEQIRQAERDIVNVVWWLLFGEAEALRESMKKAELPKKEGICNQPS